jgi:hypothetical protein
VELKAREYMFMIYVPVGFRVQRERNRDEEERVL